MRAKIIKTGEIIELSNEVYDLEGNDFSFDEVELIPSITDWRELRERYAGMAMQALIPYYEGNPCPRTYPDDCAKSALEYADALIELLKK